MKSIYLIVTPFFPTPTSWRGAYCYDFAQALIRNGDYRVLVFMEGSGTSYNVDGILVHTFPVRKLPSNVLPFLFARNNRKSFADSIEGAGIKFIDVSVCHVHTANYLIYAEEAKTRNPSCKTLVHHHCLASMGLNMGVLRHSFFYNTWLFCSMRKHFEQMDQHVFISNKVRESFLSAPSSSWTSYDDYKKQMRGPCFFKCRSPRIKKAVVLHNGVNMSVFRAHDSSRHIREMLIIGCVGNFQPLKGQMTLLEAVVILRSSLSRMPKIHLRFVGSGETLEECRKFAVQNAIDAEFLAEVCHEKLVDFYRGLDLFVLPSEFEGFGCVYTEAHSCGVPFIACENQGIEDVLSVEERENWLCRVGDARDLADKILRCLKLKDRRGKLDACKDQPLLEDQSITTLVTRFMEHL